LNVRTDRQTDRMTNPQTVTLTDLGVGINLSAREPIVETGVQGRHNQGFVSNREPMGKCLLRLDW